MTDLVIFDCDGVLVDSEGPTNTLLAENLSGYGMQITPQECMALFVGGTMASVGDRVRGMGVRLPDDWVDEIYRLMYARLAEDTPLIPGVAELLDHLDDVGTPFCVASNGSEQKMQITLGQNGLWERFEGRMFSAHLLGVAKPDPGLFLTAAARMGADPARCIVIEDSRSGVTAAVRAGIRCLAYAPDGGGAELAELGAEIIRDLSEIAERL